MNTLSFIMGAGRAEKTLFPLLYLFLQRDLEIFRVRRRQRGRAGQPPPPAWRDLASRRASPPPTLALSLQSSVQASGSSAVANVFKMDDRVEGHSDEFHGKGQDGAIRRRERPPAGGGKLPLQDAETTTPAKPEGKSSDDDAASGIACETFFDSGLTYLQSWTVRATMIESVSPPEILVHVLVTPDDDEKLLKIVSASPPLSLPTCRRHYSRVNVHCDVLDPLLHTPASTFSRCPSLFTVVCASESMYFTEFRHLPIAMRFAKHVAASALLNGWKSVELSQAIATNFSLHVLSNVKPKTEKQEREMVNQTHVWLMFFNLDRSTSVQFDKSLTIKEDL
ncbi:hypothetical protein L226DRAFT_575409 [Lentinus tigrinus ALCF2SS1-7]|uniref:uncharacterized protein n=1 Tax=Lentinus tigrinus ALCF2SS1-7 TaxID=1328758 RepID=UPI0011660F0B|nr:hypothetical protein L226DRAFT_575409 [Lentinus tigrinus ALCF2SS1-7]